MASSSKWFRIVGLHPTDTGSNPVGATKMGWLNSSSFFNGGMVELVDTHGLSPCGRNVVSVRV